MLRLLALLVLFAGTCGPKSCGSAPGETATIVQKGGELSISGAGRSDSTTEWSEHFRREAAPAAHDRPGSRRMTFVAVLGGAALVLGVIGLVLVLLGRRRQREQGEAAEEPMVTMVTRIGAMDEPERTATLVCPTCREEYPRSAQFCASDGNRLVAAEGGDSRAPTGGVCPTCSQGFDPGVSVCPRHQEELVPVGVWTAREEEPPTGSKICPVCGMRYPAGSRFCGSDGGALVPVN